MLEIILSTLAEFGLIREDYKHRNKISKLEKEDGIKRPVLKYFLQPSVKILFAVLIIGNISAFLFFSYQRKNVFPERTQSQIAEMSDFMKSWNKNIGRYPTDLKELIGNNPLRQSWHRDAWNREYQFTIMENGKVFLIVSAGADGIFGTDDDIKSN